MPKVPEVVKSLPVLVRKPPLDVAPICVTVPLPVTEPHSIWPLLLVFNTSPLEPTVNTAGSPLSFPCIRPPLAIPAS